MSQTTIEQEFKPSWTSYSKSLWLFILTVWFAGFGFIFLLYPWWNRRNTTYIVSDDRVVKEWDGFTSSMEQIDRDLINRISSSQSVFEKLRGRGTVKVQDNAGNTMEISGIADYKGLMNSLQ